MRLPFYKNIYQQHLQSKRPSVDPANITKVMASTLPKRFHIIVHALQGCALLHVRLSKRNSPCRFQFYMLRAQSLSLGLFLLRSHVCPSLSVRSSMSLCLHCTFTLDCRHGLKPLLVVTTETINLNQVIVSFLELRESEWEREIIGSEFKTKGIIKRDDQWK